MIWMEKSQLGLKWQILKISWGNGLIKYSGLYEINVFAGILPFLSNLCFIQLYIYLRLNMGKFNWSRTSVKKKKKKGKSKKHQLCF